MIYNGVTIARPAALRLDETARRPWLPARLAGGDDNRICHDDVSLHGAPSTAVAKGGAWRRCFLVEVYSQDGVLFTEVIMINGRTKALPFKGGGGSRHLSVGRSSGQKSYESYARTSYARTNALQGLSPCRGESVKAGNGGSLE